MSTLSVEYAKSNRSTCKLCKSKIDKLEIRIGTHTTFDDRQMTQWRHLKCFNVTKKWKEVEPTEIEGYDDLKDTDQDKLVEHWESDGGKKKKTAQKQQSQKKKAETDDSDSESDSGESYDSDKIKGYTEDEFNTYIQWMDKLEKWKNSDLQQELQLNQQKVTGVKKELMQRVADGKTLGQIPKCHVCTGGRLQFDYRRGVYRCPGYMDDDVFVNCRKKFGMDEVERSDWVSVD